jgi:hypothetical protein
MKTVPLTRRKFALVDNEDFDKVNKYYWNAKKDKKKYYACRAIYLGKIDGKYKGTTENMHRFILGITNSKISIDHKNGNTLDNRRENLRIASTAQNASNLNELNCNNTNGFRGVTIGPHKNRLMWRARIGRKRIHLGYFSTPEEAAKAFDKAAKEMYGEFCGKLNFPESKA